MAKSERKGKLAARSLARGKGRRVEVEGRGSWEGRKGVSPSRSSGRKSHWGRDESTKVEGSKLEGSKEGEGTQGREESDLGF